MLRLVVNRAVTDLWNGAWYAPSSSAFSLLIRVHSDKPKRRMAVYQVAASCHSQLELHTNGYGLTYGYTLSVPTGLKG